MQKYFFYSSSQKIFLVSVCHQGKNERGTGLGLSLCKEMIIKNKDEIWVESVLRKGTTFFFTVPKAEKRYQQAS